MPNDLDIIIKPNLEVRIIEHLVSSAIDDRIARRQKNARSSIIA
jgi:hypothetical protein